jgi:hypothetical protein
MAAASVAKWVMDRVGWGSHDKKYIYIYCPCSRYDAPQVGYLQTLVGEFKMEEKKKAHAGGENMLILSFFLGKKIFSLQPPPRAGAHRIRVRAPPAPPPRSIAIAMPAKRLYSSCAELHDLGRRGTHPSVAHFSFSPRSQLARPYEYKCV